MLSAIGLAAIGGTWLGGVCWLTGDRHWSPFKASAASAAGIGLWLVVVTEALSGVGALSRPSVLTLWLASGACGVYWIVRHGKQLALMFWRGLDSYPALAGGVIAILLGVLVTAVASAPNDWDSMAYHLPRIEHWIQNGSVAHYTTANLRQIAFPPLAEWAMLHTRLIADSDWPVGLVQWCAWVGTIIGIAGLTLQLGGSRRASMFAAVLVATIPIVVLQASSTQVDLVVALWVVVTLTFAVDFVRDGAWVNLFGMAAGSGLALLTKATGGLILWPFLVVVAVVAIARDKWRFGPRVAVAVLLAAGINLGHVSRNMALFGSWIAPATEKEQMMNPNPGPEAAIVNSVRGIVGFLQSPSVRFNNAIYDAAEWALSIVGLDATDTATILPGWQFAPTNRWRSEYHGGAPQHLLFGVLVLAGLVWKSPTQWTGARARILGWIALLLASLLVYAGLLRWQPMEARLLIGWLVLWMVPIAVTCDDLLSERTTAVVAILFLLAAVPQVVAHEVRPLVGPSAVWHTDRFSERYNARPELRALQGPVILELVHRGCRDILLRGDPNGTFEYPLWVALRQTKSPLRIRNDLVHNASSALSEGTQGACAAIRLPGSIRTAGLIRVMDS